MTNLNNQAKWHEWFGIVYFTNVHNINKFLKNEITQLISQIRKYRQKPVRILILGNLQTNQAQNAFVSKNFFKLLKDKPKDFDYFLIILDNEFGHRQSNLLADDLKQLLNDQNRFEFNLFTWYVSQLQTKNAKIPLVVRKNFLGLDCKSEYKNNSLKNV